MRPGWRWAAAAAALTAIAIYFPSHDGRDLAAALAVLAVVAASWDPEVALIGLLGFLPFRTLASSAVPLPLKFVADAAVLGMFLRLVVRHRERLWPLNTVEWLGVAFLAYGLFATIHAHGAIAPAILEARDLMLFWAAYGVVRRLAGTEDGPSAGVWLKAMPVALLAVAVIGAEGLVTLLAVHQFGPHPAPFLVPGHWLHEPITPVNRGRPYGWVNNPNVFGDLGAIGFALAQTQIAGRRRLRQMWPYLALSALFVLMVVFSYSRSAWIAFGILVAVELIAVKGMRQAILPLVAAAVATVLIVSVPHASHRAASAGAQSTLVASRKAGRIHTLSVAETLVRREPLGTGLGTFGSGASRVFHQTLRGIPRTFYGDDNYAVLLVEGGVPGLLLFLAAGLAVYLSLFRSRRRPAARRLALGLFLVLTALGAVGNSWEQLNLAIYPWLALTLLVECGVSVWPEGDPGQEGRGAPS